MAEQTDNYGLTLPDEDDFYNVEDFNGNMEKIDTELKNAQDKADQAFQSASNGKAAIKAAITGLDPEVTIPTNATFAQLAVAIGQIETGVDTEDATAIAAQILAGMTAYVKSVKVTGTMPNQSGKSLAIANHAANMTVVVDAGDSRMGVINLPNQYPVTGYVDVNTHFLAQLWGLIPENIRYGANVGQYPGYGTGNMAGTFTGDADAVPGDMVFGKKAYVKGAKVTGSIPVLGSEEYYGWRRATVNAPSISGRVHLRIPLGAYLSGVAEQGGQLGVFCDDPAFTPANILNTANIFGMQGSAIPGKRFATGTVTSTGAGAGTFYDGATYERLRPYVSVSGLSFKPSRILVFNYAADITYMTLYDVNGVLTGNDAKIASMTFRPFYENAMGQMGAFKLSGTAFVSSAGFALPCTRVSDVHTWFAYE